MAEETREHFKSRIGFIFVAAGCAIGLGNVWRFPYITGQYGGAAFIVLYLIFLVVLGLPVMVMEFAVGKGRLLLCMSDLDAASRRPEGRAFYRSLLAYMHSNRFRPTTSFRLAELLPLLQQKVGDRQLDELNNISPY